MSDVQRAYEALISGDRGHAKNLLKTLIQQKPSADAYYYAAFVVQNPRKAHQFLRKALELDNFHAGANRLHMALEKRGSRALRDAVPDPPQSTRQTQTSAAVSAEHLRLRHRQRARRNRTSLMLFVGGGMALSIVAMWFVMLLLGVGSWLTNPVAEALGAEPGITEYQGTPIANVTAPASLPDLPAAISTGLPRGASNATGDILRDGVLHEYTFGATSGEEIAVAVQFFSPFAEDVFPNVTILDPEDRPAGGRCERQIIIDAQTGAAFICQVDITGGWKVRIFGREGASSGVYVVTAEELGA